MAIESIAIIGGTGRHGSGLALRLAKKGRRIIIGSRSEEKAVAVATELKNRLKYEYDIIGANNFKAANQSTILILCVPIEAQVDTLKSISKAFAENKILVDVTVPLETSIGGKPDTLICLWQGSAAQRVAHLVPDTVEVVSAFQTISASALHNLSKSIDSDVIVCSDSDSARKTVMTIAEEIVGVRALDGGALSNSRIIEALTPMLIHLNMRYKINDAGIRISGLF